MTTEIRKGQAPGHLERDEFAGASAARSSTRLSRRRRGASRASRRSPGTPTRDGRKAPVTRKAGPGFADPDYDCRSNGSRPRTRLDARAGDAGPTRRRSRACSSICGSPRNDGTCPGEISKTFRLAGLVERGAAAGQGIEVDLLDLSLLTSEYGRQIHPCKGCVSTAMPLCHWPCSCYPNHSLDQTNDWMNEIYERWVAAHAIVIVTPVYWYQAPSALKLMIDRLVCADGGNPDPTSTHGKKPEEAKALELKGWDYPKHLAGRAYGLVVHGDVAGIEGSRRALSDWLDWMGLIDAGDQARLDRFIGYYEPYATSHETLDQRRRPCRRRCATSRAPSPGSRRRCARASSTMRSRRCRAPRPK